MSTFYICSRSMLAQGLPDAALNTVTRATTIARLSHAFSGWWGLTLKKDRVSIERIWLKRMGFPQVMPLAGQAEARHFHSIESNSANVFQNLLPPCNSHSPTAL